MRILPCLLLLAASAGPALATGGLSCTAADEAVTLTVRGGVTRGMGRALFSFSARAELHDDRMADDLRVTGFARRHLPQYWLDDGALRLVLYREREGDAPHGYVEIVIETTSDDESGGFEGEYMLTVYDMTEAVGGEAVTAGFSGAVSCLVE